MIVAGVDLCENFSFDISKFAFTPSTSSDCEKVICIAGGDLLSPLANASIA